MFIDAVADARGLDKQDIRDTEARVYRGQEAAKLGLIDGVKSYDAVMEELAGISQRGILTQTKTKGMKMETDVEKLQADLTEAQDKMATLQGNHEVLQAAVIAEGYTINAEGISRDEPEAEPEMIEVAGVMTNKASLPDHVVSALEDATKEKATAELKELAEANFPNFNPQAAVTLTEALESYTGDKEEVMSQLKAADTLLAGTMDEEGESSVEADMTDPKESMDALVKDYMSEHSVDIHKARVEVAKTAEGRELQKAVMRG